MQNNAWPRGGGDMGRIGVLALQGDFAAHGRAIASRGHEVVLLRNRRDLSTSLDGLVLPGGESSTMLRLLDRLHLWAPLKALRGLPTLATCAGTILLAREVAPAQPGLGWLDISVQRNGYGRQRQSFQQRVAGRTLVFIRAPRVTRVGAAVEVHMRCRGDAVLLRQGPLWAATFHPELTADAWLVEAAFGGAATTVAPCRDHGHQLRCRS